MTAERRRTIADAALRVLATAGPRGLTHRAVDAEAGLKPGAVNYHAPSKSRLLDLAVERLFDLDIDTAATTLLLPETTPPNPETMSEALVGFVREMTAPEHVYRVRARHELLAEALRNPRLHQLFAAQRAAFVHYAGQLLTRMGCPSATPHADLLVVFIDSLLTRQAMITAEPLTVPTLRTAAQRHLRSCLEP
ncbi:TetR/AcrR family transcriptional regulator [Nocardia callitridis]|uniref:TetR/AcrR family transcriptional regulator n=1 Tax=Nocardia callitridis TaxID=648753 RepID=A0ABP9L352_9NOCA